MDKKNTYTTICVDACGNVTEVEHELSEKTVSFYYRPTSADEKRAILAEEDQWVLDLRSNFNKEIENSPADTKEGLRFLKSSDMVEDDNLKTCWCMEVDNET